MNICPETWPYWREAEAKETVEAQFQFTIEETRCIDWRPLYLWPVLGETINVFIVYAAILKVWVLDPVSLEMQILRLHPRLAYSETLEVGAWQSVF